MCFLRGFPPVLKADRKDMYENIINRETAGDRREVGTDTTEIEKRQARDRQ